MPLNLLQSAQLINTPAFSQIVEMALQKNAFTVLNNKTGQSTDSLKLARRIRKQRNVYTEIAATSLAANFDLVSANFAFGSESDLATKLKNGDADAAILSYVSSNWARLATELVGDEPTTNTGVV